MIDPLTKYHYMSTPMESSLSEEDYRDSANGPPRIDRELPEPNVDDNRFNYPVPPLARRRHNEPRALEFFDVPPRPQSG